MAFTVLLAAIAGCGGDGSDAKVTYYQDIQPTIERSCQACHVEGGTGPFPLKTFDDVYTVRELAREYIDSRTMPPWFASRECRDYNANLSLEDQEIAAFDAWIDGGALEGDEATQVHFVPSGEAETEALTDPDFTMAMEEAFTPDSTDEVRCFNFPWPLERPTYVTGISVNPGQPSLMHHITVHSVLPPFVADYESADAKTPDYGYECLDNSGPDVEGSQTLAGWTGGSRITTFPEGAGILVVPGSIIQLQVHYTPPQSAVGTLSDITGLEFTVDPEAQPAFLYIAEDDSMLDLPVMLPEDDPDVMLEGDIPGPVDPARFTVSAVSFHMHSLGTGGGVTLVHPDGTEECLLDLFGWDPAWQQSYVLKEYELFEPGDKFHIRCEWDNSQENQPVVDGEQRATRDIPWGVSLDDEMCRASIRIVADPED